jgi:hypothetical protein
MLFNFNVHHQNRHSEISRFSPLIEALGNNTATDFIGSPAVIKD